MTAQQRTLPQQDLWQMEFPVDPQHAPAFSEFLDDYAVSTMWYEKEKDSWQFEAIFQEIPNEVELEKRFRPVCEVFGIDIPAVTINKLPNLDWVAANYKAFPPLKIARFYIYGSHIENPHPESRIPLQIDAATAFGSGEHETTEGCLWALDQLSETNEFKKPLDMGCGSGVLALAMATILKVPVVAVDNDPEAVRVTASNAIVNNLAGLIKPLHSEGFGDSQVSAQGPYDLIMSNILAGPLCEMSPHMCEVLQSEGFIILSGLLNTQAEKVISTYRLNGCALVDQIIFGDWSTLVMRKI